MNSEPVVIINTKPGSYNPSWYPPPLRQYLKKIKNDPEGKYHWYIAKNRMSKKRMKIIIPRTAAEILISDGLLVY